MNELLKKYKDNTLSANEMAEFRRMLENMSDEELANELKDDWTQSKLMDTFDDEATGPRIYRHILRTINPHGRFWNVSGKIASCAAVILCIVAAYTIFTHTEPAAPASQAPVLVKNTGYDRTSLQLPDGSDVTLNQTSELSYSDSGFNTRRVVKFKGTGHFKITPNTESPFTIEADGLSVTVLGTEFYLWADSGPMAALYLEKGKVTFKSASSGREVDVAPNQLALLDYATGTIAVSDRTLEEAMPYFDNDVNHYFKNERLEAVAATLNELYAPYSISLLPSSLNNTTFTGSLPKNNLMEAISILQYTADLQVAIAGNSITLYR